MKFDRVTIISGAQKSSETDMAKVWHGIAQACIVFFCIFGIAILSSRAAAGAADCSPANVHCVDDTAGPNQEYLTMQAAVNAASAGDTILVFPGVYDERITFPAGKTGQAGNKIIIKSETKQTAFIKGFNTGKAAYLRIEGFDITYNAGLWLGGGIWLSSSSYTDIVDNYFHDIPGAAIQSDWSSNVAHDNIYVANNRIYKCNKGIVISGRNWIVENNDIERLIFTSEDADYIRFFGENHIIRNNYLHGTFQSEIGSSHTDGFQTFANNGEIARNIIIEGNVVRDFYHQGMMMDGRAGTHSDIIVRNNIFADSASWGIDAGGISNLQIVNNNFINMAIHGVGFNNGQFDGTPSAGIVQNNIFYNGGSNYWKAADCTACVLLGGNNIISKKSYPNYSEAADIVGADPLFVNVSGYDFNLQSNSPAINKGVTLTGFTSDKDGISRPQGSAWDIGAHEYVVPVWPDTAAPTAPSGLKLR